MKKTTMIIALLAGLLTAGAARAQIGLDFLNLPPGAQIGDVLARLYVYGVGLVAIIAVIMLVIGGVQYMVAGEKDPSSAKERIRNAIWGLILALCSYLILYTINPDLTKKVELKNITPISVVPPPTITSFRCDLTGAVYDSQVKCLELCVPNGNCTTGTTPSGTPPKPIATQCPPPGKVYCFNNPALGCFLAASKNDCGSIPGELCDLPPTCPK